MAKKYNAIGSYMGYDKRALVELKEEWDGRWK